MERKIDVVIVPLPGKGHLPSAVELAKRLADAQHHHFAITIFLTHIDIPGHKSACNSSLIDSAAISGRSIRLVELPPIDHPIKENQAPETFVSLFALAHKAHVKQAITSLLSTTPDSRVAALIVDFFATTLMDVGKELGIPTYLYFTSGAAMLGLMLYLPTLEKKIEGGFGDYEGKIEVPGFKSLPPAVMPSPLVKRNDAFTWFVYHGRRFREMSGLIVNTFHELEPTLLTSIRSGLCLPDHDTTPPVYPIGPLLALENSPHQPEAAKLLEWLDQQPHSAVLYLCFGSMGALPPRQVHEIAIALERSGHRFLWCLRSRSSLPFSLPVDANLDQVLPPGFLDRTQGRGLVWPSWVPQVAILGHKAVGGFVSHCGWNSSLESIWFGVPILAWPLYAEQKLNAFQMVREYGLAVELKVDSVERDGWVSAEELEKGVRCLMEDSEIGKRVRENAKAMAQVSRKAVKEGGSSFSSFASLAEQFVSSAAAAGQ